MSWLDIPTKGSYLLSATRRRELAKSIRLIVEEGDDKSHINITIIDQGIGIKCEQMENTILNLGGGNKVQKPYLMGAYMAKAVQAPTHFATIRSFVVSHTTLQMEMNSVSQSYSMRICHRIGTSMVDLYIWF